MIEVFFLMWNSLFKIKCENIIKIFFTSKLPEKSKGVNEEWHIMFLKVFLKCENIVFVNFWCENHILLFLMWKSHF